MDKQRSVFTGFSLCQIIIKSLHYHYYYRSAAANSRRTSDLFLCFIIFLISVLGRNVSLLEQYDSYITTTSIILLFIFTSIPTLRYAVTLVNNVPDHDSDVTEIINKLSRPNIINILLLLLF